MFSSYLLSPISFLLFCAAALHRETDPVHIARYRER